MSVTNISNCLNLPNDPKLTDGESRRTDYNCDATELFGAAHG